MVWGCFSAKGMGALHLIDGIMDQKVYRDILLEELNYSTDLMGISDQFVFKQDLDPKHTAPAARNFFEENRINQLEWSPQSPDLNPIENLWEIVDRSVPLSERTNKKRFFEALKKTWYSMDTKLLENLVNSIPRRLTEIIQSKGGPTKN